MTDTSSRSAPAGPPDPMEIIRSKSYLAVLALGAAIGVPVAVVAYYFLTAVTKLQKAIFTDLPKDAGFHSMPSWWPLPWLFLSGILVAAAIRFLPGTGGHEPSDGFQAGGGPLPPIQLFGVIAAALATLSLGAVLGPEAPLIAIGSGLGALTIHLAKRDAPQMAVVVLGAAGSFAAISTLLGSPIVGAFLLMEAIGLGGALMEAVLIPGLLAAGIGALIFIGLGTLTGLGTYSLVIAPIPHVGTPTAPEFGWALVMGLGAALLAAGIFHGARALRRVVEPRRLLVTPLVGLAVGGLAAAFAAGTGRSATEVLFSGQSALPTLVSSAAGWSVGALVLLLVCKAGAYSLSLSGFRGGPIFPAMFIGAAGGIALSHAGGMPMIAGVGIGIAAMTAAALRLPMTAVVLPSLLLAPDAVNLIPLFIVASVCAYVASVHLLPRPVPAPAPASTS
jgi:H+/Cl- antiporter ClcA